MMDTMMFPQAYQEEQHPCKPNPKNTRIRTYPTSSIMAVPSFQWPAHMTVNMADAIHEKVKGMLSQSRLLRQADGIQLIGPEDIWKLERRLGAGAFSQVSEVTAMDGRRYACKHLKEDLLSRPDEFQTAATELAYEAHMMSSFDHPNILKIRGWAQNGISSFEDGRHDSFFLLLDLLDETLDQRIERWSQDDAFLDQRTSNLRFLEKLQILIEIASALDYVHDNGVIFRDLKPNNIGLLHGQVQLFDFGLSRELPTLDTSTPFQMSGKVGTIRYMAPEVVLHQPYNVSADVYSWTMVAYEVLTGEKPFSGWTPELYTDYVCKQGMRPDVNSIPHLDLQVLLQHSWQNNATQRPSLKHIIAQLQLFQDQHRLMMEQQELQQQALLQQQQQQQLQLQLQQQQQQQQLDFYIDLDYMTSVQNLRPTYVRAQSEMICNSVGTLETESISAASLGW
jgi:serine/threonine protein kinase